MLEFSWQARGLGVVISVGWILLSDVIRDGRNREENLCETWCEGPPASLSCRHFKRRDSVWTAGKYALLPGLVTPYYICIDSKTGKKKKRKKHLKIQALPLSYYICISGHAPLDTLANLRSGYFITKRRRYPTTAKRSIQNKWKKAKDLTRRLCCILSRNAQSTSFSQENRLDWKCCQKRLAIFLYFLVLLNGPGLKWLNGKNSDHGDKDGAILTDI